MLHNLSWCPFCASVSSISSYCKISDWDIPTQTKLSEPLVLPWETSIWLYRQCFVFHVCKHCFAGIHIECWWCHCSAEVSNGNFSSVKMKIICFVFGCEKRSVVTKLHISYQINCFWCFTASYCVVLAPWLYQQILHFTAGPHMACNLTSKPQEEYRV